MGRNPSDGYKEFSLKKRIRRDRMNLPSITLWRGSQAITPPAFLFLNLLRCQTAGTEAPKVSIKAPWARPEVAAYMGRPFPRQHPFLRFLQKIAANRETCNFQRRTGCLDGAVGHRLDR